jgi:hypothetical protein
MKNFGFVDHLIKSFNSVPDNVRRHVNIGGGLHEKDLIQLLSKPKDVSVSSTPPKSSQINFYHDDIEEFTSVGEQAILHGDIAFCVLAGSDMSLTVIPEINMSFFDLKIQQAPGNGPIWFLINPLQRKFFEDKISHLPKDVSRRITLIDHFLTYKLSPDNLIEENNFSTICGSGDIFSVLATQQNLLKGIQHIFFVDVENVFASLDPAIVGYHLRTRSKVTCEVVKRKENELGDILVNAFDGPQIAQVSQINDDLEKYTWLSTSSYVVDVNLQFDLLGKIWHRTAVQNDKRLSVQYRRFIQEITSAYMTSYLGVSRSERYMPVRNEEDVLNLKHIISNWHL